MRSPVEFLKFWFRSAPLELIGFFGSLNSAFLQLFSLSLLIKTFFKPWKNEYREGLVGFSIGMGMLIKTFVIIADIVLFIPLILLEVCFVVGFLIWPIATFFLLNRLPLFFLSFLCVFAVFFLFKKKPLVDLAKSKKQQKN